MKLKDFLTLKVGSGILVSGTRYSPLINYDWSTTTTSGLRYLKDIGSTPTYNASMYFGRGVYLNGVDQSIDYGTLDTSSAEVSMVFIGNSVICCHKYNFWTVRNGFQYYLADGSTLVIESILFDSTKTYTLNITPTLIELFENGVKILTKIPKSLLKGGAKTIGTRYTSYRSSIIKDLFMFNRTLTQAEITQSYEQPEAFYTMAQADSACVLNMPMCETDGYVRNMKSYSEGSELDTSFVPNTYTPSAGTARIAQFNLGLVVEANKTYLVEIKYDDTANSILTGYNCYGAKGDGTHTTFHTALKGIEKGTKGTAFYLLQIPSTYLGLSITTTYAWITTTAADKTAYISVRSLKEVTGVYPITNYTTSVRANAKNLQYGLQTCKFVRNSLGVIQSASDYLECDGVGYINTKYKFNLIDGCSFTIIVDETPANYFFGNNNSAIVNTTSAIYLKLMGTVIDTYWLREGYKVFDMVYKNNIFKLYRNGVLVRSTTATAVVDTYEYYLGGRNNAGVLSTSSLTYRLFQIHNKALTQAEIIANYNSYVAKGLLS